MYEVLPFSSNKPLFDTIKNKYLLNVLKWLGDYHDSASTTFLGAKTGSTWGVAYSLICLFEARDLFLESELFPRDFDERAYASVEYLSKKATIGTVTCHWESNIWDSAVITRALLRYTSVYLEKRKNLEITQIIEKSLQWLHNQVIDWHDLRYTLGLTELSQILRTFLVAETVLSETETNNSQVYRNNLDESETITLIINEILHSAKYERMNVDGREEVLVWDDSVFGTGETLISLSHYLGSQHMSVDQPELQKKILGLIGPALRYLELEQKDGRWGIEEETAMVLRAYIVGHRVWGGRVEPEPHIVFKGLRYLCDSKTVFLDGSIAHELEPTVYYTMALIEALKNWDLPNNLCKEKSTIELYDYIIWNTPSRSTYERLLRTRAESEASVLRSTNQQLTDRISVVSRQLGVWQTLTFALVWLVLLWILLGISDSLAATTLSVPVGWKINDWGVFLALVGAWAASGGVLYRFLIRGRLPEN